MIEKVTYQEVKDAVYGKEFILLPDMRTTICMLTLDNGFTVTGQSTTVDRAHFDKTAGEEAALKDAESHIWMLLAYRKFEEANR